ncbi:nuclear transport factor 2 family protein [Pseudoxanthomonas sp.]|uniref:nuclear transport factor 2 family protein n=1 Tax=Pseudoxanthomonas sp. TaxID=1871049 RepID=UPI00261629D3|nr:nuclear transport factor 2 family protein [Pseudoxanthomonas sp.]WDS37973.1 MAG: nuclear transport factor 2 family protein [Pseudoxanthomonas sp.]
MKHCIGKTLAVAALIVAGSGAALAETPQEQANIKTVLAFYQAGLNDKNADAAIKFLGSHYTQHNPNAADGPEGFRQFVAYLRDKHPQSKSTIERSFGDGDYVILHVHAVRDPGDRGDAIVDIFKLDKGKIVEHWDVTQAIPEKTASGNPML